MYIPRRGINYTIRTFIAAMLEMLRRWQWNFCEHLLRLYRSRAR